MHPHNRLHVGADDALPTCPRAAACAALSAATVVVLRSTRSNGSSPELRPPPHRQFDSPRDHRLPLSPGHFANAPKESRSTVSSPIFSCSSRIRSRPSLAPGLSPKTGSSRLLHGSRSSGQLVVPALEIHLCVSGKPEHRGVCPRETLPYFINRTAYFGKPVLAIGDEIIDEVLPDHASSAQTFRPRYGVQAPPST